MKLPKPIVNLLKDGILSNVPFSDLKQAVEAHAEHTGYSKEIIAKATIPELVAALTKQAGVPISLQIVPTAVSRTRDDIGTWFAALQAAENAIMPRRNNLYKVYKTAIIDLHLESVMGNRTRGATGVRWKVMGKNGEDTEKSKLLAEPWFYAYVTLFMETKLWGHSLLEFGQMVDNKFESLNVVNRRHVRPELGQFVIKENDSDGIKYRGTSVMDWCVELGAPTDLGLLYKICPHTLWKKNALADWSVFDEKFGVPFRYVKTPGRSKTREETLARIMQEMGQAGWAIIQDDESIEIMESAKGDVYQCFNMLIERCNSEMSKGVLGQTMTTDNGSSKSQGEVHERIFEQVKKSDLTELEFNLNSVLKPFMIKHGFPLAPDDQIKPDLKNLITPAEKIKIDTELMKFFNLSKSYISRTYDIPEEDIEEKTEADQQGFKKPSRIAARARAIRLQLPQFSSCPHCGGPSDVFRISAESVGNINELVMNSVFNNQEQFSPEFYQFLVDELGGAVQEGFKGRIPEIEFDAPDYHTITMMEANIFRFSAAKNLATLSELNRLATESKDFNGFRKEAVKVLDQVNGNYLRTEYNFAVAAAQNAANYRRQMANADVLPYLEYVTAGDSRVRPEHAELDGKVFRVDDPVINTIYPPNGWGCRCMMVSREDQGKNFMSNGNDALDLLRKTVDESGMSEYDRMVKGGFNINRGNLEQVFTQNQMYIKGDFKESFGIRDNKLQPYDEIKDEYSELKVTERTADEAKTWYEKTIGKNGYLVDYAGRPSLLHQATVDRHLTPKYIQEGIKGRQNTISEIGNVLKTPDEVYYFRDGSGGRNYFRYIKFYNNTALNVLCSIDKTDPLSVSSWYIEDGDVDMHLRTGLLIHKKKKS